MNEYLKPMQKELEYSDDTCELLESIGIVLTEYGHDCHKYNLQGSPIDISYIDSMIFKIRDTEFLIETEYSNYLTVCKETVNDWASIIIDFWEQYPEY